jgi:hypothetical protein
MSRTDLSYLLGKDARTGGTRSSACVLPVVDRTLRAWLLSSEVGRHDTPATNSG